MAVIDKTKTHQLTVPHETGHWIDIRFLSGSEMDEAKSIQLTKLLDKMGSALKDLNSPDDDDKPKKDDIESRRIAFDPEFLIDLAVKNWSYEVPCENPGSLLDGVTRDWLWNIIVDENTRPPASSLSGGLSLS